MAMGNSSITQMKLQQAEALRICKDELSAQLEVFKTNVAGIRNWATETTIGKDVEKDLSTVIEGIDGLINLTRIVCGNVGDFCYKQEKINRSSQG